MRINDKLIKEMKKGLIGIEKENVRVDRDGKLAMTEHPSVFGKKDGHPYIQADFSESQIEMITPPLPTIEEAYHFLENIHDVIAVELEDEYLWPSSMPPILPVDESAIPIAIFENKQAMQYREQLAEKYGRKRQLICGVHANISFNDEFFYLLKEWKGSTIPFQQFKDKVYLRMARAFLYYVPLLTQLTGASPVIHPSFNDLSIKHGEKVAEDSYQIDQLPSIRNSDYGYTNKDTLSVSFGSLDAYIKDLKKWISEGYIQNEKEFYCPVRLKSRGETLQSLEQNGIDYLEIRLLDLNPFEKIGVSKQTLYLLRALLLQAALEDVKKQDELLLSLLDFVKEWELGICYEKAIQQFLTEESISKKIVKSVKQSDFILFHLQKAKSFKEKSVASQFQFAGASDLELSTQILLRDAIRKGLYFEFLDRKDHFITLSDGIKTEYVKQATKTSLDSYSTVLAMENKHVTKRILAKKNIRVPNGIVCHSIEEVVSAYDEFANKPIVIKPNSTNFGIGITIFPQTYTEEDMKTAAEQAFFEDSTVLVEEFYAGKEYRFLVIDGEVVGVLHRVPANVIGDGVQTIEQLVDKKNQNSLRGVGYKTPLEKIRLGDAEKLVLKSQGKTIHSVLNEGELVYLRENSNISTGGDSIDFTDEMHASYNEIACQAANAVDATICGVDIIIENISKPATDENYVIIELNFNPAIHIHCFPYKGKNRQAGEKVLTALFPELRVEDALK